MPPNAITSPQRRAPHRRLAGHASVIALPELQLRDIEAMFSRYVCSRPLAYALFRVAECRELARVHIDRPVLDLGCGEGEFGAFALKAPPDLGIDLLADRLAQAQRAAPAGKLARADARRLPLADGAFASVLSMSVLEHFERPADGLAEIARVLRPGGRFVATIVLADIHRYLFHPQWLRFFRMAGFYVALHDRVFKHKSLLPKDVWEKMLSEAGLQVIVSRKIVSPTMTRAFDFFLLTAWPYRIMQRTNTRWVWRPRWMAAWCWRLFQWLSDEGTEDREQRREQGSTLLIVAEKPA